MSLAAACGDDGVNVTTETSGSTGSTGSVSGSTTNPTTTNPTTTDPTTGSTGPSTTDASSTSNGSTTNVTTDGSTTAGTSASTTDASTSSTTDASTSGSSSGDASSGGSSGDSSSGSSTGMGDLCANGMMDQDETDVDCGGAICGDCADGQQCLVNEDCVSQSCAGGVCITGECTMDADCAGKADACNTATCDVNMQKCVVTPKMDGTMCDDSALCTTGDVCKAGVCGGTAKDCSSLNSTCGAGVCEPGTGNCIIEPLKETDGIACDDKNGCTTNTTCLNGVCGDPNNKGYKFYDSFANNTAGWTLGTNWEIKPAVASPAGGGGTGADPATDRTPTMDNGVAGTLVGGLLTDANVPANQQLCLTSPVIDTSAMPTVWWTFWRHLHADYPNWAIQRLEVFNGNAWVLLQTGYGPPVTNDVNWTEVKFDVTQHKNAKMQVRICNSRVNAGSFNHGGWSVDDVTIAPISCTP